MFFKKSKEIIELKKRVVKLKDTSEKFKQEIEIRNKTACPKCRHSIEAYEWRRYRNIGSTYVKPETIYTCRSAYCLGFINNDSIF